MGRKGQAEIAARRSDVKEMLLLGKGKQHIVSYITKNYGLCLSGIENDITICYKEIREYAQKHKEEVIELHIARYEKIHDDCVSSGNYRDALKALAQKEALLQLLKAEPLVQINTLNLNNYTDEQLRAISKVLK